MKKSIQQLCLLLSAAVLCCFALTGCVAAPAGGTDADAAVGMASYSGIIMIVVMIAVFYFFLIRPEQKKKKKAEEMRSSLGVGDKITTIGGMVGKIVNISGDLITFETGEDRVRIQVTKWAISTNGIQKSEDGQQ